MRQTAHIPIVFMTGLTETEHLVAALEAGGVDYVTKPIKPKEVLARMSVHLQGARAARRGAARRQGAQCARRLRLCERHGAPERGPARCGRRRWRATCCRRYCGTSRARATPPAMLEWLRQPPEGRAAAPGRAARALDAPRWARGASLDPPAPADRARRGGRRWLIVMREVSGRRHDRVDEPLPSKPHAARGGGAVLGGEGQDQSATSPRSSARAPPPPRSTWSACT
jgi:hypothetical protein